MSFLMEFHVLLHHLLMHILLLETAVQRFERLSGCSLEGYCVDAGFQGSTPFYSAYLELKTGHPPAEAEKLLDTCFCESCFGYRSARGLGQIGDMRVLFLRKGAFAAYREFLAGKGYRMEQNKPLRILQTQEQKDFFKGEVAR